jgi:hypothetical protein
MRTLLQQILHDLKIILTGYSHQFDGGGLTFEEKIDRLKDYHPPYAH